LCHELDGIAYRSQVALPVEYKGVQLPKSYLLDLLVNESVIVEIKAVEKLLPLHSSPLLSINDLHAPSHRDIWSSAQLQRVDSPRGIKRVLL
jgi:GxxExxY protein